MQTLVAILQEQVEEYSDLLELAQKKQRVLVDNDIEKLNEINKEEEKVILNITKLENKRLTIISTLKEALGTDLQSLTLKEIAQQAPEPYQQDFQQIMDRLNEIIQELTKINEQNSDLIHQSLEIINYTIGAITQKEREVTYPEGDSKSTKQINRILDTKA